jgi:hypothetical protein
MLLSILLNLSASMPAWELWWRMNWKSPAWTYKSASIRGNSVQAEALMKTQSRQLRESTCRSLMWWAYSYCFYFVQICADGLQMSWASWRVVCFSKEKRKEAETERRKLKKQSNNHSSTCYVSLPETHMSSGPSHLARSVPRHQEIM